MQFSWHLLFYNTEYRRTHALSISEFFSSISAVLTFHKCHVKEPSTITQSQIQKHALPLFLITKLNKLPPFIHLKLANSHMNCHPSASPSPGLEVSLFPRTTADSAKQFCSCSKNREKRVHEHSHLTHKAFCFRQWSLHNVYQYIHITSPVGNASAVEAFSSGLISAKTRSATSNGFCCIF